MKHNDSRIEKKYEDAFSQLGEVQTIFPVNAKIEMAKMVEEIVRRDGNITNIQGQFSFPNHPGRELATKAGKVAEEFHAETYNLRAILKSRLSRAFTDKDAEWKKLGLKPNDTQSDIVIAENGKIMHKAQVKYWANPEKTSKDMHRIGPDGRYKYDRVDEHIGPSDQVHPKDGSKSITDYARETAIKEEYKGERPEVARAARDVQSKNTDRLAKSSKPLSKKGAESIAKDKDAPVRKAAHDEYQSASTFKHMKQAAVGAASITAIASGVINTASYIRQVREGKITESEAVVKIVAETASSAADSALKASAVAGAESLLTRYGSRQAALQLAKSGVQNLARTNIVTIGVLSGIDLIKNTVALAAGRITSKEFEERSGKSILNTSAGVLGSSVGTTLGMSLATGFSAGALMTAALPIIGGISGGLIAGLAMQMAIENEIERPYREMVENTQQLKEAMTIFEDVSEKVLTGQAIFAAFLAKDRELDTQFAEQQKRITEAGDWMKGSIDKL